MTSSLDYSLTAWPLDCLSNMVISTFRTLPIAEYFKERGTTAEGEVQAERPISPWQADARVERKPRTTRRAAPGIGRSANASYLQERTRSAQPPGGGLGVSNINGTGRAQRRRFLPCESLGGHGGEARRSGCSSALPCRWGAGTWPGSPPSPVQGCCCFGAWNPSGGGAPTPRRSWTSPLAVACSRSCRWGRC
jgi:hypothetical protein